jgi:cytochrome c1
MQAIQARRLLGLRGAALALAIGLAACGPNVCHAQMMGGGGHMRTFLQAMIGDLLPPGVPASALPDPDSDGAQLVASYCSQCHGIPSPALHTPSEWPTVVARMVMRIHNVQTAMPMMIMQQVESPTSQQLGTLTQYLMAHGKHPS